MLGAIREFFVKLGLSTDAASFASGQVAVEGLRAGLGLLVRVAEAAGRAIGGAFESVLDKAGDLRRASQMTGISMESLQGLDYAAHSTGVSVEEMRMGLIHLSRNMNAAAQGAKESERAFADLGVQTKGANGGFRSTQDVLEDVADRFKGMPDGAEKTAIAMQIFGRSGAQLIPVLNKGADGLAELDQQARDLGVTLSDSTIQNAIELKKSMRLVGDALDGVKNSVVAEFLPSLKAIAQGFAEWIKAHRQLIALRLHQVLSVIGTILKYVWVVVSAIGRALNFVIANWRLFAAVLGGAVAAALIMLVTDFGLLSAASLASAAASVGAALASAGAWLLAAAPVALLIAFLAAVILIAQDVYTALTGGKSVVAELWNKWSGFLENWMQPKESDPWWLVAVKDLLWAITHIGEMWDDAVEAWKGIWKDFTRWLWNQFLELEEGAVQIWKVVQPSVAKYMQSVIDAKRAQLNAQDQADARDRSSDTMYALHHQFGPSVAQAFGSATVPTRPDVGGLASHFSIGAINVNVNGNGDPNQIAGAVTDKLQEFHDQQVRKTAISLGLLGRKF